MSCAPVVRYTGVPISVQSRGSTASPTPRLHTAGMTLHDRELDAMQETLQVLSHLDEDAQRRVTSWVSERVARAGGVVPPEEPEPPIDRNFPKARAFVEVKAPRTKFERLVCLVYWATRDHRPDVRLSDIDQLKREVGGEVFSDAGSVAQ